MTFYIFFKEMKGYFLGMTHCFAAIPGEITLLIAQQSSFYQAICLAYLSRKNFVKEAVRKRIVQERYGPFEDIILSFNLLWKIHTNDFEGSYLTYNGKILEISKANTGEGQDVLFDIYRRALKRPEEITTLDQYKSAAFAKELFHKRITTLFERTLKCVGIRHELSSCWFYLGQNIFFTYINTPLIGGRCEIKFQDGIAVFLNDLPLEPTLTTAIIFAEIFYKDPRETVYVKCGQNMINAFYAIGCLPYEIEREIEFKDAESRNRPFFENYTSRIMQVALLSKKWVEKPIYESRRKKHLTHKLITQWDPEIFRCYLYKRAQGFILK